MQEAIKNCPHEARDDLIDSLIAVSLLTRRMAKSLIDMNTTTTTKKGDNTNVTGERAGHTAYRVVRA